MKKLRYLISVLFLAVFCTACASLLATREEEEASDGPLLVHPGLTDADFPDVLPCLERNVLPSDEDFLDVLTVATELIHTHKVYESDANLPAVCGLPDHDNTLQDGEVGWDPLEGEDVFACNSFDEDILSFVSSGSFAPSMCRLSYSPEEGDTDDGFPRTGTYHTDVCFGDGADFYSVRLRIAVTGVDTSKTWTNVGVNELDELSVYDQTDVQVADLAALKALIAAHPTGVILTVRSDEGETTHLTVGIQIVCVMSTSSCPVPDETCE